MPRVAVIYFSKTGITHQLAEAIRDGVLSYTGAECNLYRISGSEIQDGRFINEECLSLLDAADAICFGSPTYMGGPAAQFKAFADKSGDRWEKQTWANKIAAGFTTGTSSGGDQLATLQYFSILAMQLGMIWVGLDIPQDRDPEKWNPTGTQIGFAGHILGDDISSTDYDTAH